MSSRAPSLVVALLTSLILLGCPSKDSQSSSGAASPPSGGPGPGTGPLATLESAPFLNEVWISQEGQQMPFIFYSQQNVRVSTQCRQASGQLACDAMRQIRGGMPVEIPGRELTGGISAGTKACMKLGKQLVSGHNSVGAEDGFCRFPDGSMISTGALEQYGMRVIQ
jgi:putative hemolysin